MSDQMPPMPSQWAGPPPYPAARPVRPPLDPSTPVYTPWTWVIVFAPLVQLPVQFLYRPEIHYRMLGRYPVADLSGIFTPAYLAIVAVGLLLYAIIVVSALLDRRELVRRGVERPFHWAWAFLSGIVYTIGRAVIVHRVARPRGLVPIWVLIGVYVLQIVVSTIWSLSLFAETMRNLPYPLH